MHKFLSFGLGVFDEVSVSSRNFNQVSVSKVTVSTTSLLKRLGQIQRAVVPRAVFVLKWGLFHTFTWEAIVPQSIHLPPQTKSFPPSQSKVL